MGIYTPHQVSSKYHHATTTAWHRGMRTGFGGGEGVQLKLCQGHPHPSQNKIVKSTCHKI